MEEELRNLKPVTRHCAFIGLILYLFYISCFLKQWMHIPALLSFILLFILSFKTNFVMSFYGLFTGIWMLCTLIISLFVKNISLNAILSFLASSVYILFGYHKMNHVVRKHYTIQAEIPHMKLVQMSDLHIGSGLSYSVLKKSLEKINQEQADLIIITGDIVDESTSEADFLKVIPLLKELKAQKGKYYILGNHDLTKDWQKKIMKSKMQEAGFILLEDEQIFFDDFSIIGRQDAYKERKSLDTYSYHSYTILLDHQPVELKKTAQYQIELELCGHTHNGQIWPMGLFARWFHENELVYGFKKIQSSNIIVTSGLGGWGYPIRTEGQSEYVVIDIQKN